MTCPSTTPAFIWGAFSALCFSLPIAFLILAVMQAAPKDTPAAPPVAPKAPEAGGDQ